MEQLEMNINDTSDYLSENGHRFTAMPRHMEARFGRLVFDKAVAEKREPAVFIAKGKRTDDGKLIEDNCLPPTKKPPEQVTGNQLRVLSCLMEKPKKRATIAEELDMPPNSVSGTLQTLGIRHLVRVQRKVKRFGRHGSPVHVYGISEAGRRAVEATE